MRSRGSTPSGGRRRGKLARSRGTLVSIALHAAAFIAVAVTAEKQRVRKPTRITVSEVVEEEKKKEPEPEPEPEPPPPPPKTEAPKKLSTETNAPEPQPVDAGAPKPLLDLGMLMSNSVDSGGGGGGLSTGVAVPVPPKPGPVKPTPRVVAPTKTAQKTETVCTEVPSKPEPIEKVEIEYPVAARQAGLEGRLVLRVFVDADGKVDRVEVLSSVGDIVDNAAIEAVRRWRFTPAKACGKGVEGIYSLARRFELGD